MNATQQTILTCLVVATLLPLASCFINLLIGKRFFGKACGWLATAVIGLGFALSLYSLFLWLSTQPSPIVWKLPWIPLSGATPNGHWLYLGALVDSLTVAMMTMVTGISCLVHLYSVGYMKGDPRYERFFAYLSLFTFSMLGIVMSHSLVMIFVFWELVGLTSYLLIGFWFEKTGPQLACRKAFVMNRIGDMGFLIGFGLMFYHLGGQVFLPGCEGIIASDNTRVVSMLGILQNPTQAGGLSLSILHPPFWLTIAGIGLFFGAMGKSAQFPLHTWLPDAMEGPTPVSSIVHSATMVAAGVYLTARLYPILTPSAHLFIACIGLITLVIAALMALVMHDIKRVLAYSTLSQLGYMTLGLGAGAYGYALYHLMTHAFFKCALFQCAGSVIHGAHHEQDMRQFGGLWRKMPLTAAVYLVCLLAIAGASIPMTHLGISGFYSKDGILAGCVNFGHDLSHHGIQAGSLFYIIPMAVAYLTVFYMTRSFALTFLGKPRNHHLHDHVHEAPWTMVLPGVILAAVAVVSVPMGLPWLNLINASQPGIDWVQPATLGLEPSDPMYHGFHVVHTGLLQGWSWIIVLLVGTALFATARGQRLVGSFVALPGISQIHHVIYQKFYLDHLYDHIIVSIGQFVAAVAAWVDKHLIDGMVNLVGRSGRLGAIITGKIDQHIVDGAVNGAAELAQASGQLLRNTQVGRLRIYVLLTFASLLVAATIIVATLTFPH